MGIKFLWWVWLANTGKVRDIANQDTYGVKFSSDKVEKTSFVLIHTVRGTFRIWSKDRHVAMKAGPLPRLHDRDA